MASSSISDVNALIEGNLQFLEKCVNMATLPTSRLLPCLALQHTLE